MVSLRAFGSAQDQLCMYQRLLSSFHAGCGLVVDAGFSFTHAVPIFDWHVLEKGVRRMDLGGKALTNQMKTLVSYRCVEVDGM